MGRWCKVVWSPEDRWGKVVWSLVGKWGKCVEVGKWDKLGNDEVGKSVWLGKWVWVDR